VAQLEAVYTDQVAALCQRADGLIASQPPAAALAAWMRDMVEFSATKHNLTSALAADYDKDAPVFSACRDDLLAAAAALLTRAQQAGVVRADVQPLDLLRLSHGVAAATERATDSAQAERLLSLMLDGVMLATRPTAAGPTDPAGGSRTEY
jgi:hypothetical protein